MNPNHEILLPGEQRPLTAPEFAEICGLRPDEVRELEAYGLIGQGETRMNLAGALVMRQAVKLKNDFDLDLFATGLLAQMMERIARLQETVAETQARMGPERGYTEVSFTAVQVRVG